MVVVVVVVCEGSVRGSAGRVWLARPLFGCEVGLRH